MKIVVEGKTYQIPTSLVCCTINNHNKRILQWDNIKDIMVESYELIESLDDVCIKIMSFQDMRYKHFRVIAKEKNMITIDGRMIYTIQLFVQDIKALYSSLTNLVKLTQMPRRVGFDNSKYILYREEFGSELQNNDYAYEEDSRFSESIPEQLAQWNSSLNIDELSTYECELAFSLHNSYYYKLFCCKPFNDAISEILNEQFKKAQITVNFSRVYIGNEFCPHLAPSLNQLGQLLRNAKEQEFDVTICSSFITERSMHVWKEYLSLISDWCHENEQSVELIFNDWGMLNLVQEYKHIIPVLGRLLNIRKKDPRLKHAWGYEKNNINLTLNPLNTDHFSGFLKRYGVNRFEYELHNTMNKVSDTGRHSLHFPYYQIGTAADCTLNALCVNNSRYKQSPIDNCPEYCRSFKLMYPQHLQLLGYQNSIWGFAKDPNTSLNAYRGENVDRLVYTPILCDEEG